MRYENASLVEQGNEGDYIDNEESNEDKKEEDKYRNSKVERIVNETGDIVSRGELQLP